RKVERAVGTREVSLLAKESAAKRLDLPVLAGGDPRPFEVIGIPLPDLGYQVVEIESQRLGAALLDKQAPMYVRPRVLVTNLGVPFKLGRENSVVWVTSLGRGRPVADAEVAISGCDGKKLWSGRTDAQGVATVVQPLVVPSSVTCNDSDAFFVSARKADAK